MNNSNGIPNIVLGLPDNELRFYALSTLSPNTLLLRLDLQRREQRLIGGQPVYTGTMPLVSLRWAEERLTRRNFGTVILGRDGLMGHNDGVAFIIEDVRPRGGRPSSPHHWIAHNNTAQLSLFTYLIIPGGDEIYRDFIFDKSKDFIRKLFDDFD
jgi:hypothetical protein